jgi:hypothetical protein
MERKRKVGVACLLVSFPVGMLSLGLFMEEATNGATFPVPSWVGLIAAVVLFLVGIELGAPEHQDRW